mmetsp:Transcript_1732/g.3992  ORF Transcript_1732/g.3992 Transcript_1732/m.3992 type:complete len:228 (-) Transcript_1732:217-900(-)
MRPNHVLANLVQQNDVLLLVRVHNGRNGICVVVAVVAALTTEFHPLLFRCGVADGYGMREFGIGRVGRRLRGADAVVILSFSLQINRIHHIGSTLVFLVILVIIREEERFFHLIRQSNLVERRRGLIVASTILQRIVVTIATDAIPHHSDIAIATVFRRPTLEHLLPNPRPRSVHGTHGTQSRHVAVPSRTRPSSVVVFVVVVVVVASAVAVAFIFGHWNYCLGWLY